MFQGEWKPPMIKNPDFVGEWRPAQIPNPDFYELERPLASLPKIGGIALEIWTTNKNLMFDNILICTDPDEALAYLRYD